MNLLNHKRCSACAASVQDFHEAVQIEVIDADILNVDIYIYVYVNVNIYIWIALVCGFKHATKPIEMVPELLEKAKISRSHFLPARLLAMGLLLVLTGRDDESQSNLYRFGNKKRKRERERAKVMIYREA